MEPQWGFFALLMLFISFMRSLASSKSSFGVFRRFLYETMQDANSAAVSEKEHARGSIVGEIYPHFPEPATKSPTDRHADRLPGLHRGKIRADLSPIVARQAT